MSEADDRSLEEEARTLLGALRATPAVPAEAKARAFRRLSLALPLAGLDGGAQNLPGDAGTASAGRDGASVAGRLGRALGARVPAWSLVGSFVAGGALALAVTARAPTKPEPRTPAAPVATVPPAAPPELPTAPTTPAPAATDAPPPASTLPSARPPASSPALRPGASVERVDALEAERALLDVARAALGRGDGGAALVAVNEHARRFPRGALAEEREAMSIQALRLLHREDEASARLERFRARFPASLIRPALEAASGDGGTP